MIKTKKTLQVQGINSFVGIIYAAALARAARRDFLRLALEA